MLASVSDRQDSASLARRVLQEATMFHNSSHKKFWIFKSEGEVEHMRYRANQKFRTKMLESGKVSSSHAHVKTHACFSLSDLSFFGICDVISAWRD